jgi:hypothetical protein
MKDCKFTYELAALLTVTQVLFLMFPMSIRSDELDYYNKALKIIENYADRACKEVPLKGTSTSVQFSGDLKVGLKKLISQVVDLGFGAAGKYKEAKYEGLLQSDLVSALKNTNDCYIQITKYLGDKLLNKTKKKVSKRKKQETKSKVLTQSTPAPLPTPSYISQNIDKSPGSSQIYNVGTFNNTTNYIMPNTINDNNMSKNKTLLTIRLAIPILLYDVDPEKPNKLIIIVDAVNNAAYDLFLNEIRMTGKLHQNELKSIGISEGPSLLKSHSASDVAYELLDFTREKKKHAYVYLAQGNNPKEFIQNPRLEDIVNKDANGKYQLVNEFKTGVLTLAIDTGESQITILPELIVDLTELRAKEFGDIQYRVNFIREKKEKFLIDNEGKYNRQENETKDNSKLDSAAIQMNLKLNTPLITEKRPSDETSHKVTTELPPQQIIAPNSVISVGQKGGITANTVNNIIVNSSERFIPDNINTELQMELSKFRHKHVSIRIANNEMQGNEPIKFAEKLRYIFSASGWDVVLSNSHNMIANGVVATGITLISIGTSNIPIADFIYNKLNSIGLNVSRESYVTANEQSDLFIQVWTK